LAEGTAEGNRNWLWPQAALKASAHLGPFLDLTGGYAYGPKEETFDPQRTLRYLHSGEMNLNTDLSFIKAWPFEDSSLRTYGKLEYLPEDPNWIGTAVQEAYLGVLDKPGLKLDLLGNLVFQHAGSFQHEYYTPIGVLVAGGGLRASSWINLAEGTALSVSLRASGASYREKLLSAGAFVKSPVEDPIKRLQLEGEANLSLIKGEATYSVRVLANSTWCYWKQNQPVDWDRDYWSLYLSLGYSARMPRLLAP